ncbi:UDP-N-acetylglucosamine 2-epimerase (non-hydrolyzing) [Candidatus Pelagibacter sp.]|nr:UDP-N-acetylglucosamine 2-epimerase (non-hydrolyzing) [Candidatus Pelagibacter sp.]
MFKVCTIIGTRPEIIKLSSTIKKIDKFFKQVLVHTGQNYDYELNQIFFKDLSIRKPDYYLNSSSNSTNSTIAKIIQNIDKIFLSEKPDCVMILGDTNSGLAAIAAKKRNIPIFHIEAGNRSFDQRVPEELNRKLIDHCSDINFTYTNLAKNYLIQEGLYPDRVINIGSPMLEVINDQKSKINKSNILKKLKLKKNEYFLISFHREENVDVKENLNKFFDIIKWLNYENKKKVVISTHYRTKKRIVENNKNISFNKNVMFLKPFSFSDYIKLQKNSYIVLSDSGTLTEETSILKTKSIMLRNSHERPEGMEEATTIMCGLDQEKIQAAIKILNSNIKHKLVKDYNTPNFSDKIVKNILSYLNYNIRN